MSNTIVNFYCNYKQNITDKAVYHFSMNEEAKNFARNLRLLMEYYGHNQKTIGKKSGLSQKTISNMLNPGEDRAPNLENVAKIAKAYKLQTWHLLIPNAGIELLTNISIEKIIDNFMHSDEQSRDTVLQVSENAARYNKNLANRR